MRIGVDARELTGQPTGVGRVLEGLLEEWPAADDLWLYARTPLPWRHLPDPRRGRIVPGPASLPGALWEQTVLPRALRADRVDALLSPAYGMPALTLCRVVVGMHDCACEATPWQFDWRHRQRRRWTARRAARRASYLFTGSRFAAEEIRRWYGTPRHRVVVAPYGVSRRFRPVAAERVDEIRRRYEIDGRSVLFVGAPLARRRLGRLIDVFGDLLATRDDLSLLIAGPARPESERLAGVAAERLPAGRVRWLGFVPDRDLPTLYSAATVVAYPSTYEGFGLPVLEALACGTPVVASSVASLGEIFAGRAWLVPPHDAVAWQRGLATLLDDEAERRAWSERGSAWAHGRSWAPAARLLRRLLLDAVGRRPAP